MARPRPERLFVALSLGVGLLFLVTTPPFQTPDEPAHFARAFALSEGRVAPEVDGGRLGATLPSSLGILDAETARVALAPEERVDVTTIRRAFDAPLDPDERAFRPIPVALYPPMAHVPQATGILVGRLAGLGPLPLLYLARLFNLVVATALIGLALRWLPAYRWLALALASTPIAVFLRASASADPWIVGLAFLTASLVARGAFSDEPFEGRHLVALVAASVALVLTKLPYLPLVLAGFLIPARRLPRRGRWSLAAGLGIGAAVAVLWAVGPRDERPALRTDLDPEAQIEFLLEAPQRFAVLVAVDYARSAPRLANQLVGKLGWLDVRLPWPLVVGLLLWLLVLLWIDGGDAGPVPPRCRAVLGALVLGTLALVAASLYVFWTPPRADRIDYVQGRYLHPVAPFAIWIVHRTGVARERLRRWVPVGTLAVVGAALAVALVATWWRYYGPG